jgi:hypothetical protein
MPNDIENDVWPNQINLSEINKYNKFIDFGIKDKDHPHFSGLFHFTNNELKKEKLTEPDRYLAMVRMQECLNNKIEAELKEDYKLQSKIKDIEFKAKKRIEKLKEKPLKKLQKKYGIDRFDKYFEPKLDSSEEPSTS